MPEFKGKAKSLEELYVYYQRLKTDGFYPTLSKYVNYAGQRITSQTYRYSDDARAVRAMARAEFNKEKALLSEVFGINFDFDYYGDKSSGKKGIKEVVEAINSALNLKDVYERNLALIKYTKGQKGVYSWFPTYFMKAWNKHQSILLERIEKEFYHTGDLSIAIEKIINKEIDDILIEGIQLMLDGPEVENGIIKDYAHLKDAYSSLVNYIGKIEDKGSVAKRIYDIYQIDELKKMMIETIKDEGINMDTFKGKTQAMINKRIHQRGGFTLEAIEQAIYNQIGGAINGKAIASGQKGVKADNIFAINIDEELIYNALEKSGSDRNKNIDAFKELGEKMSHLNKGFIVYSSDKNQTLNKKFAGFHAGSVGTNALNFVSKIYGTSRQTNTLVGAIHQLGKGAILEGREEAYEKLLAQEVAYMLFDDYGTIGESDASGRAIHIMNLNGILIPLSLVLTLLADAIEEVEDNDKFVRQIVSVRIKAKPIEFKTQHQQDEWQSQNPDINAWEYQRDLAINQTNISANFLKKFSDIVKQFL